MDSRPPIKRESDSLLGAGLPEAEQFQIKIVKQESDPGDYQRGTGSSSVPQIPGFPQTNPGEPQVKIKEEVLDPSYHVDPMDGTVLSFTVGETDPETLQMKEEGEGAASGSYVEGTSVPFADGGFPSAGQEIYQTKIKEEPDPEFYPNPVKSSVASLPDGGLFTEVKIENEQMDTEDPLPTIRSEIVSFPVPGAVANAAEHRASNEISEQDREEMRRQLFEELRNMWGPVENEPCFQDDPVYTEEELQALREREKGERLRNTRWCQCGNCISLPTTEESVCCREIAKLKKRFRGGVTCIIQVPEMQKSCLDAKLLDYMVRYRGKVSKEKYTEEYPQVMRKAAYRAFTIWTHRFFREKTCTAIPACVVNLVRTRFPYPPDRTVGLLGLWDYPAIDMAFDG
ncbi:uncharacterized protein LOC100486056 isoform X2 [Xenopus tropicalis]|uniref:Uncharacterized protein LOC100486056 isoform X2 n=1 Tax=Xenopus tropicalis TaxID=8364 RepID=A0A8J0R8E7_XENTR|nr:uncharacterized protein LOC100486056 isoform X2 [Xenopus tropicalis]|eukprot:XP_004919339.1 PREDICTED: uncharacterized protein LOC100486056 isoform X2 [Xenopus tropicalis]